MTIERIIDPNDGWDDQVGLRLRSTADDAQAIHRALRALFRGRMSPPLPNRRGGFTYTILVPASEQELDRRWDEVMRLAGLTTPMVAATPAATYQPPPPSTPVPAATTRHSTPRRVGTQDRWEQQFRTALKAVLDSESRPASQSTAFGAAHGGEDIGDEGDAMLLEALPPTSRLRVQITRYAQRGQHEQIVALCAQRRQDVLALPASELLVSQLLAAHQGESQRCGDAIIMSVGRDLALAFLPELERLSQAEGIRARLRRGEEEARPEASSVSVTLDEQLAALVGIAPADRLAPLEELRGRYPAATKVQIALADAHAALGDAEQALALYRLAHTVDDVADRVATLLLSVGRARDALTALEGRGEISPRRAGLRGAALMALGDAAQARPLLGRAWDAGERSALVCLAYARALVAAGNLEGAAEPYQIALEATPDRLGAEDCHAMAEIAAGAGYGILSGEEEAVYLDRYIERAGRRLHERPDAAQVLRTRVELRRAGENPDRLRAALADWLEYLAERGVREQLNDATHLLGALRREGALSYLEQFELLEGIEHLAADAPGLAELLALEYQAIAIDEIRLSLRQGRPVPAYIGDLRRAMHFLNRADADTLAQAIELERQALAERSMEVPAQTVEEAAEVSLDGLKITIVGGHVATRREVKRELCERHGLVDYAEVAPSSEAHVDRDLVRDHTVDRDLVVVIASYTGHDLTGHVRDLQRSGDLTARVIWPRCRGKSGVVRGILEASLSTV